MYDSCVLTHDRNPQYNRLCRSQNRSSVFENKCHWEKAYGPPTRRSNWRACPPSSVESVSEVDFIHSIVKTMWTRLISIWDAQRSSLPRATWDPLCYPSPNWLMMYRNCPNREYCDDLDRKNPHRSYIPSRFSQDPITSWRYSKHCRFCFRIGSFP